MRLGSRTVRMQRLVAAVLLSSALAGLAGVAPVAAQDDNKLTIAYTGLGSEVFRPDRWEIEAYPATAWNGFLVYAGPGSDRTPRPGLAESWAVSDDELTYMFSLRTDATFSDGTPVTAEDVVFSIGLVIGPESVARRNALKEVIASVEAVDSSTVQVTLSKAKADFLLIMSSLSPYIPIISKAYFDEVGIEQAGLEPMGAGGYEVTEHRRGEIISLEAVDNSWLPEPDFNMVDIRLVPEESTRIAMLKSGEADIVEISAGSVDEVEAAGFRVISSPGAAYFTLGLGGMVLPSRAAYDPTSPLASDDPEISAKVREALCLAIDKDAIQQHIFGGTGQQFSVIQFLPGTDQENPDWRPIGYDPERAKTLLAEAGYPNGFDRPLKIFINREGAAETADVAEAIAMYWEALGLRVEREGFEDAVFQSEWYQRTDMQIMGSYLMGSTPQLSPVDYFDSLSRTTSAKNQLFESLELDALIDAVLNAPSEAEAQEAQRALGDMVYYNSMHCPILLLSALYAVSDRVEDWPMNIGTRRLHNIELIQSAKAN